MKNYFQKNFLLNIFFAVILIATLLRFWNLGGPDMINDEALNSFRAIGLVDFLNTEFQTTPLQWLKETTWWIGLSFHDHPIFSFMIQNTFFFIFGISTFVARTPAALAGIISVALIYLYIKQGTGEKKLALLGGLLLAINTAHLWISRTALQEPLVIALGLGLLVATQNIKNDSRWWYAAGVVAGLGMLTKYTFIIFIILAIISLLLEKRQLLKNKKAAIALALTIIIFSPAILYNIGLAQTFGHFDLQLSYIFQQDVPEWQNLAGKSDDGFIKNIINIAPGFTSVSSLLFIAASILAIIFTVVKTTQKKAKNLELTSLYGLAILILMFGFTGPAPRFLTMTIPFLIVLIVGLISKAQEAPKINKQIILAIVAIFVVFEGAFSVNTFFTNINHRLLASKELKQVGHGYEELEKYLQENFDTRANVYRLQATSPLLDNIGKNYFEQRIKQFDEGIATLVIIDENINYYPRTWYLTRRSLYQGLPIVSFEEYRSVLAEEGEKFYHDAGFLDFVFIKADDTLRTQPEAQNSAAEFVHIISRTTEPIKITRPGGATAFRIFEFK